MKTYDVLKDGRLIMTGTCKEIGDTFGVNYGQVYDASRKMKYFLNEYKIKERTTPATKTTLTPRQKEIIEQLYSQGQKLNDIAYNTGILEIHIKEYIDSLEEIKEDTLNAKKDLDYLDKLIEEKIKKQLADLNIQQETEPIMTFKALGYKFNDGDKRYVLKDDMGHSKRSIQLSNNMAHIRTFDKAKSSWSMPYTITYDEIEAIYNEITNKRGY